LGIGIAMESKENGEVIGKTIFALTTIAMLVFFWWLLIYDHGVVSAIE
jgi:hypothetical protein